MNSPNPIYQWLKKYGKEPLTQKVVIESQSDFIRLKEVEKQLKEAQQLANHKCKAYAVYCNPDHTHLFVGMHPSLPPSKLMEQVKSGSSKWLNEKKYIAGKFQWQDGYGAFSYSKSHIDAVVKYVLNQPKHHKKQTFREEYLLLLRKYEIDYDEKYLFEYYD
jgi:putative transposase